MTRVVGYHGETRGPLEGAFRGEVYLGHERGLAESYASEGGRILEVVAEVENPLVFTSAEHFRDVWMESGSDDLAPEDSFHPDATATFCEWIRARGYDAVVLPADIFEGEVGFEFAVGTFGEPQTIILDPTKITNWRPA